jgi:anti-sigma B factor antagonist
MRCEPTGCLSVAIDPDSRMDKRRHILRPVQPDSGADGAIGDPTPFAIDVAPTSDQRIRVSVFGELDLVSSSRLERALRRELLSDNDVLLDLSQIEFIDSTGLHAIVSAVRTAKGVGRKLNLSADLPPHARRLMEIVGLLPLVPIAGDERSGDLPERPPL